MSAIFWEPWNTGAFARARAEHKPVLLSISASWSHSCHEMDRTSYGDPDVASVVNARFVPIRVDADRRPDIWERYSLGGLPTTAFLTADGDLVGGGTFVPRERMAVVLDRVVRAFSALSDEMPSRADATAAAGDTAFRIPPDETVLLRSTYATFDRQHGGFGTEPKFPLVAPVELALHMARDSGRPDMGEVAAITLDAMGWSGLHDEVDGGFHRSAATKDWREPHEEKLLDVNAGLLALYILGWEVLHAARYGELAQDVLRYVQTWLADPVDGGWAGSQSASETYYAARTADERRQISPPPVDRALYASANAAMASAALRASVAFGDEGLGVFALKSLERVVLACYAPGSGVAHYFDGQPRVRGLLDDQIAMAAAQLDAYEATGNIVYEMLAEELAHYAINALWDDAGGGFFDRAAADAGEDVGLMRRRLKPFVANCDAARVLYRLAVASGEPEFRARADAALAAVALKALGQGPLAAHYLLALREARVR